MKPNPTRMFWAVVAMVLLALIFLVTVVEAVRRRWRRNRRRANRRTATPYEVQLEAARIFGVETARVEVSRSPDFRTVFVEVPRAVFTPRLERRLRAKLLGRVPVQIVIQAREREPAPQGAHEQERADEST